METKSLIQPTPETINEIYKELGTSEAKLHLDVEILKEWMRKQPHLPNPDDDEKKVDEKRIKTFLLLCKNSLEKTKARLDQHYTIKALVPEYFCDLDSTIPELIDLMENACIFPLPKPTQEGNRVSLYCVREGYTADNIVHQMKLYFMTFDLRIGRLDTFKKDVFILDYKNVSMNQVTASLPNIRKIIESSTAVFPLQIHSVHVINAKSFMQPLLNLMMSLLKKKISKRVYIYKSAEELRNNIDPSVLPLNYGGTYPKTSDEIIADWQDEVLRHREWFLIQSSIIADNSKRPKNASNNLDNLENTITGGSFRKLEVD